MIDLQTNLDRALLIIKPDAILKNEVPYAKRRLEEEGLRVIQEREVQFNSHQVWHFYPDKRDHLMPKVAEYLSSGKSLALVIQGEDCFRKLSHIKREMRSRFYHQGIYTGTHTSDNYEEALREMRVLGIFE